MTCIVIQNVHKMTSSTSELSCAKIYPKANRMWTVLCTF